LQSFHFENKVQRKRRKPESAIQPLLDRGIRNPRTWNPESTAWNPESKALLDYLTWADLRYQYNPFYCLRAVRFSARYFNKTPINHTFFESLIITDYNKFHFKPLKFTVFQKCEDVYKTACLYKSSYTPAKISREKTINMAFVSSHIDLQNCVSDF